MGHTSCDYIQFIGSEMKMPHAIIRGKNGRRHEVDFGAAPIRVEIYASEETVEIFVEADFEMLAEERRRFAIINIPATFLAKLRAKRHDAPQRKIANALAFRRQMVRAGSNRRRCLYH